MRNVDFVGFYVIQTKLLQRENMLNKILVPDRTRCCHNASLTDKQVIVIKWQVTLIKGLLCLWQCAIHIGGKHTKHPEKTSKRYEVCWQTL